MNKPPNDPHAPEAYCDGATGYFSFNGNMRIAFEAVRPDHSTTPNSLDRVVISRVVMPIAAAEAMANSILEHLALARRVPDRDAGTTRQ